MEPDRALAQSRPRSLADNARLFALVNMTDSDAFGDVFASRAADCVDEVKQARIWAGVHYRRSTEVASERAARSGGWRSRGQCSPCVETAFSSAATH